MQHNCCPEYRHADQAVRQTFALLGTLAQLLAQDSLMNAHHVLLNILAPTKTLLTAQQQTSTLGF